MKQTCLEEFADDKGHSACRLEVVHIGTAIRINPRQERNDRAQLLKIAPVDLQARRAGDGRQMNGVVGRAAGCEQAHGSIDDRLFVDAMR